MKKRADSLFALAIMKQNKTHVGGCHECRYESIVELVHDLKGRMIVFKGFCQDVRRREDCSFGFGSQTVCGADERHCWLRVGLLGWVHTLRNMLLVFQSSSSTMSSALRGAEQK
jgi:hypothetical protein